jgi:ribonuclease HI
MRVFTDGACSANGQKGAKGGYAAWFPDTPDWSEAHQLPDTHPHTNNRAELSAIRLAVDILVRKGCIDQDIVIYSDSEYSIKCLTVWITGWVTRGWKTSVGKDVLNRDLIEEITGSLSRFKTHRFVHVKAHTGGTDDLSKQNDVVDRMAREVVEGKAPTPHVLADVAPGCPATIMGPAVSQPVLLAWMRQNLESLDAEILDKHLFKAFVEICKAKKLNVTRSVRQKVTHLKVEVESVFIEKVDTTTNEHE